MTLAELDALIDATDDAAMILLVEGDWRATMRDPAKRGAAVGPGRTGGHRGVIWVMGLVASLTSAADECRPSRARAAFSWSRLSV